MATTAMTFYGFSNVDISKQIFVSSKGAFAGISRANQTVSIYHGEELVADCTMPSAGVDNAPTVVRGELTLHDETFTGFVEGETYTIVAGDEPPITGFAMGGGLFSFDPSALWYIVSVSGQAVAADGSESRTNYTISQKITTTKKRYDIKRLPEELLPKTVATKAEVWEVQTSADAAQSTAKTAQSTADAAQSTADAAQSAADAAQSTADAAQSAADAAQSAADAAQSVAETAMNKIPLNPRNFLGSLYSKKNEIVGWYKTMPYLVYESDTGKFRENAWEPTGIRISDLPDLFMCAFDGNLIICSRLQILSTGEYWISGVAFDWFRSTTPIYYVFSNNVDGDTSTGINLTLSPYRYFLLASSTPNSTKQFKLAVDDSGAISATEVVE